MNKQALRASLEQQSIPKESYCLEGGLPNEAYCLQQTTLGWEVYYSERGNKTGLETFPNEEKACDYLYQLMLSESRRYS